MCGICGYRDTTGSRALDLEAMTVSLVHRGPDDMGLHEALGLGLGHRRLSIIDLSPAGHQPMFSANGRLVIVFNGEIYNYIELREELIKLGHQFHSQSDTEVILAAYAQWGSDCVKRFNGMWAFALWDLGQRTLFCSRDRFGVKPFYYLYKDGLFVFGSEPKAILVALPEERKPDWATLHQYLTAGVVMNGERSFYVSIRQLRPAHNLFVSSDGILIERYWNYPRPDSEFVTLSSADLSDRFRSLFLDAVRLRARSDVEVGTTLSGGLDSSAIVAAFRHMYPDEPHRSYSAVFTGKDYDETEYIDAVASAYNLQVTKIEQTSENLLADLRKLVWHLDSPLISPAIVPLHRVLKVARASGTPVLYDGQGADELLAGYDNQFYPPYLHSLLRSFVTGRPVPTSMKEMGTAIRGMTRRRIMWLTRYLAPWTHGLYRRAIAADQVLTSDFLAVGQPQTQQRRYYDDPLNEALYKAHSDVILPGLLHYGDAVSMASSVEYRLPFMDYRLVEFAFSLPSREKIKDGYTKKILRNATQGLLIDKVRQRRWKNGFSTPMRQWILEQPAVIEAALNEQGLRRHGVFSPKAISNLVKRQIHTNSEQLASYMLRWVTTELWLQECIDS